MAENILPYKIKYCPKCKQEKTTLDFHKNKAKKDGLCCICKVCAIANVKKNTAANPEVRKAYLAKWREENPSYNAEYYARDPEWHKSRAKKYFLEQPEKVRKQSADWCAANRAKVNETSRRRAANKKQATPAWADRADMELFYQAALAFRMYTGEEYCMFLQICKFLPGLKISVRRIIGGLICRRVSERVIKCEKQRIAECLMITTKPALMDSQEAVRNLIGIAT